MRSEVLTMVKLSTLVFRAEDGGSMFLQKCWYLHTVTTQNTIINIMAFAK
jgi:hypothetical protein